MKDPLAHGTAGRRQMEERFRAAFESSAIGMGLLTLDGRILAVNATVCAMSGYSEAELKQRSDRENTYPEDVEVGMDLFAEMLAGKRKDYSVEKRYMRKNGEVFWARLTLSLVRDDARMPAYLVGMVEDIDQQKRTLAGLLESEARFRAIYENAAIGISLIGPDGSVLAVNPVLVELSGYSEAELIRLGGQGITYAGDRDIGRAEFQEILAGGRDSYQVEKRYVHKDGRLHWMRQSVSAVRDPAGGLRYLVVIAEDIDQRKQALEELRESEARFKAMFDNAAVGMAMVSLDRTVMNVNQTCARITGYPVEELVGANPNRFTHPDDIEIGMQQIRALAAGQIASFQMEKRFVRKNGDIFWGRVAYSAVPGADGKPSYLVGSIEDITEEKLSAERLAAQEAEYRRQLEQRIDERTQELNRANERLREKAAQDAVLAERTRLARDLHDAVTQTLFSATLIADVLPSLWEINQPESRRRLEELRLLTRAALAEMRTLLVELRPNALVDVPLPTLLRHLVDALAGRSRINIQLSTQGEGKLPADVQVGFYRIAQEALNNVVKHSGASQAVLTLRLGESARLTVADNGKGFDPSTVTADHLGLKIMRERAEAIGAKLSLYTDPDEGTQVSVLWQGKMEMI